MKTQIRHNLLKERDALSPNEIIAAGNAAASLFLNSEFTKIPEGKSLMLYASFRNEMPTWTIIDKLFDMGIKIILPKTSGDDLIPYEYGGPHTLAKDSFGILSPDPALCGEADTTEINTVLVPGIGFDKTGNRLGFGRGYYDRFLPNIPDAVKIGLCYNFQIRPFIPVNETDVPMDLILTESGFINCKK
ncbi:MAG: 5-formyltetrahydrofolate cyclo-ligase [Firmicutes bacterium]|nr:5-formyltetrahydrofolate cyclo-ligase [Bacillota bacterium]MBQ4340726.1 5-formyltetrahydrofolate cyclo-ligase [Bacillota bacterium]